MTVFPEALRAHLEQDCTTTCNCWRLERRDGVAYGFTDHDRPLVIGGLAYEPETGFSQSEARSSAGMAVDTVDIEGALSSQRLSEADIAAGLYDGATVETLLVNWQETSQRAVVRKSVIGRIVLSDGRFVAELESIAASLDRPSGRYLRRTCDATLGDDRCGKLLAGVAYNGTGTVEAVTAPGTVTVSGIEGFESGWFSHGRITWSSGALSGRTGIVGAHSGGTLVLPAAGPMPEAGDTFSIVAGCDKMFSTCKAKFANAENFRGFPHLPGNDAAYGYVTEGGQFDGGPVVP